MNHSDAATAFHPVIIIPSVYIMRALRYSKLAQFSIEHAGAAVADPDTSRYLLASCREVAK